MRKILTGWNFNRITVVKVIISRRLLSKQPQLHSSQQNFHSNKICAEMCKLTLLSSAKLYQYFGKWLIGRQRLAATKPLKL